MDPQLQSPLANDVRVRAAVNLLYRAVVDVSVAHLEIRVFLSHFNTLAGKRPAHNRAQVGQTNVRLFIEIEHPGSSGAQPRNVPPVHPIKLSGRYPAGIAWPV